ncbi:MAG TPA: DUF488 domain-containing protein [Kofleriaceae bacterium]|nr:DUF488 domain-containing protein [Kofleriaceae bacterium]
MTVFTIGHSTRSLEDFLGLVAAHGVGLVVDVRRFPASRRHPHFAREALARALGGAGVEYRWVESLGGRRSRRAGSPHTAWMVAAFAGYADHMDTPEFAAAAAELVEWSRTTCAAILCAEARPEQCHRRLISDWLTAHDVTVSHILGMRRTAQHRLPEFARVVDGRVVYDGGQLSLGGGR